MSTKITVANRQRIESLVRRLEYPGFKFTIISNQSSLILQLVAVDGRCNASGEAWAWKGRKWLLSQHMTDGEVVWTAFKAVLTALEHEARELFKFDGATVANSHVNIHTLVALHKSCVNIIEKRKGPTGNGKEDSSIATATR